MLMSDFTKQLVDFALKEITHSKAPSPDGMPQFSFNIIGKILGRML